MATGWGTSSLGAGRGEIFERPRGHPTSTSKLYKVISLLNCLKKIAEKIIVLRLAFLAETTDILNYN